MKKLIALLLVTVMAVFFLPACGEQQTEDTADDNAAPATQVIQLGTSAFSITVDESFQEGEISAEDTDDSQVGYYFSDNTKVDFDVYQWTKATGETLEAIAADEAVDYDNAAVAKNDFGGIEAYSYEAVEEYEGQDYNTVSYLMEDGDTIVELVFWLDGDDAQAEVDTIMATLVKAENSDQAQGENTIVLGTSNLSITPEKLYKKGEISSEDTDDDQVGYYLSDDTTVDFDVYQWAKASDETLASIAADEAEDFNAEVKETTINGMQVLYYNAVEQSEGQDYNTVSYLIEDGDFIVELVFWLDGDNAQEEVDAIMATLAK